MNKATKIATIGLIALFAGGCSGQISKRDGLTYQFTTPDENGVTTGWSIPYLFGRGVTDRSQVEYYKSPTIIRPNGL